MHQPSQKLTPYENKSEYQQNALRDEADKCRQINPAWLMNLALDRLRATPQLGFSSFGEETDKQRSKKPLHDVRYEISNKEKQREIDREGERKIGVLEKPANRGSCKTQLAPMVGEIASVMLILLPKLFSRHRGGGAGGCRVPGFPVGGWLGGSG